MNAVEKQPRTMKANENVEIKYEATNIELPWKQT